MLYLLPLSHSLARVRAFWTETALRGLEHAALESSQSDTVRLSLLKAWLQAASSSKGLIGRRRHQHGFQLSCESQDRPLTRLRDVHAKQNEQAKKALSRTQSNPRAKVLRRQKATAKWQKVTGRPSSFNQRTGGGRTCSVHTGQSFTALLYLLCDLCSDRVKPLYKSLRSTRHASKPGSYGKHAVPLL